MYVMEKLQNQRRGKYGNDFKNPWYQILNEDPGTVVNIITHIDK